MFKMKLVILKLNQNCTIPTLIMMVIKFPQDIHKVVTARYTNRYICQIKENIKDEFPLAEC
jgi:hypothetical protein